MSAIPDWTRGERGLALQRCPRCANVWYFRRDFCPGCGAREPEALAPAGGGTVEASTRVHRAPDDAFRALAPYRLVLVRLDEGPRAMGHGDPSLVIGAPTVQPFAAKSPITSTDASPLSGYVNSPSQRLNASSHIGGIGSPVVPPVVAVSVSPPPPLPSVPLDPPLPTEGS